MAIKPVHWTTFQHAGRYNIILSLSILMAIFPGEPGLAGFIRLDALALSVIAMGTWLAGWLGGCLSQPVLYQND